MTYKKAIKMLYNGEERAYRGIWYEWTNDHIFLEDNIIKRTTGDWPMPYTPSNDDIKAADWVVTSKPFVIK